MTYDTEFSMYPRKIETHRLFGLLFEQPMFPSLPCFGSLDYTTFTNLSIKYLVMCKVYTDVGGIK